MDNMNNTPQGYQPQQPVQSTNQQHYQQPVYQQPMYQQPAQPQVYTVPSSPAAQKQGKIGGGMKAVFVVIACLILLLTAAAVISDLKDGTQTTATDDVQTPTSTQETATEFEIEETPETNNDIPSDKEGLVELSFAQISAKVAPSVVTINAYYDAQGDEYFSQGSGFIISADGYVVTNSHVVDDEKNGNYHITVTIHDGEVNAEEFDATVIGVDSRTDIAVLKINVTGLPEVTIGDSTALVKGDEVVAIGNPGGSQFAGSITTGVISGIDRILDNEATETSMRYLQTDAAISPGNSGGPLVNIYGQVIGINSVKIVDEEYENLGFAIPMATAVPIIEQLIEHGSVQRPVLGITVEVVSEWAAQWQDIPVGVRIRDVARRSSLYGQVKEFDIIVECDGETITTMSSLQAVIESKKIGQTVELKLYRPGEGYFTVTAELISSAN